MTYPSNSHKARSAEPVKEEKKKIERVVTTEVVRRKKGLGKRFTEIFVSGDKKSVVSFVAFDVILPAAKEMVSDAFTQGIERMLFGESRGRRGPAGPRNGYVSYNRYSTPVTHREESRQISRRARGSHQFDEIILATRVEAEETLDRLFDLAQKYQTASVADLYELVGIDSAYTDDKWGWTDLRGANVTQVRGGYLLDLPKPEPLD